MANNETVLKIEDLTVHYVMDRETVKAVNSVSFELNKGEVIGLVGETGAGKTTTALSIMNLVPNPPGVIKSGKIEIFGKSVLDMTAQELSDFRGETVSMIFQDPMTSLNPVFSVGEQIAESIRIHEKVSDKEAFAKAENILEMVGIPKERAHEYPHQFSGGMKQRVVIAISFACNPKLLLADEPTTALDVTIQAQVLDMMINLKKQFGTSMIFITHDLGIVAEICDKVAVMYAGQIIEYGTLEEVFNHTKHPYTEGLFNSLPDIENPDAVLKPIPGLMPDPTNLPEGCIFAERCQYAKDSCRCKCLEKHFFSDSHYAMCSRYDEDSFAIQRKEIN